MFKLKLVSTILTLAIVAGTGCTQEPTVGTSATALTGKEATDEILAAINGADLGPPTGPFQGWSRLTGDVYEADILNQTPAAKMRCRAGSERYEWENSNGIACERLTMWCCRTCYLYPGASPAQCCGDTKLACYVDRVHGY